MRIVAQRVTHGAVTVDDVVVGTIGVGLVLLVGVTHEDTEADAELLSGKIANLRIFPGDRGHMDRSVLDLLAAETHTPPLSKLDGADIRVGLLVISQFTLHADIRKGRRPSFTDSAKPELAEPLIEHFVRCLRSFGLPVATGQFGAHMNVIIHNDGPVTIWLDSDELRGERSRGREL